ncbi:histidine kinase [Pseudomonas sp. JUb96]|uniref:histidine kinase n=1 Tax=Pseudomonas sp. JUb96 TaxID=2940539 RepID=UPI002227DE97|nr:histidine kinase [Pseudomonas sp. JUb96]MCW2267333.1 DNA-binding NtrC family response regulator [Pseudomonas sp. JUb96]
MPNKSMRILIADEHPMQLMQLEKMLNGMGYYRIAPVECFEDLQRLVQSALQPFNLLLGNIDLANHVGVDLERFCRVNWQIQHALLYQSQHLKVPAIPNAQRQAVNISLPKVPDNETLQTFMGIIDAPRVLGQLPGVAERLPHPAYTPRRMSFGASAFSRQS